MNYYEELGIEPSASGEDIHRAHRRLTRLLHPDHQTDNEVKRLAETQMRRLNAMVEILADPEKRRHYDQLLNQAATVGNQVAAQTNPASNYLTPTRFKVPGPGFDWYRIWQLMPWWVWSTVGALILTFSAVWFLADNLGSSFGGQNLAYVPPSAQEPGAVVKSQSSPAASAPSVAAKPGESAFEVLSDRVRDVLTSRKTTRVSGPAAAPEPSPTKPAPTKPAVEEQTRSATSPGVVPAAAVVGPAEAEHGDAASLPPPPALNLSDPPKLDLPAHIIARPDAVHLPAPPAASVNTEPAGTSEAPASGSSLDSALEGEWIYAPTQPEKERPGFFAPEFIHLKLFRDQGTLHGQYDARYHVVGRPYPPEVSFSLIPYLRNSKKFIWQSSNGSRGMLRINPLGAKTIKVEWRTTVFSREPSLTMGTATLVRRSP